MLGKEYLWHTICIKEMYVQLEIKGWGELHVSSTVFAIIICDPLSWPSNHSTAGLIFMCLNSPEHRHLDFWGRTQPKGSQSIDGQDMKRIFVKE